MQVVENKHRATRKLAIFGFGGFDDLHTSLTSRPLPDSEARLSPAGESRYAERRIDRPDFYL
jgi:hypothetical protein